LHKLGPDYEFRRVHQAIGEIAKARGVPVIDLLDCLSGQDPPSLWVSPGDPHPNNRAQELFAAQLHAALMNSFAQQEYSATTRNHVVSEKQQDQAAPREHQEATHP
jgi:hypothetical protein